MEHININKIKRMVDKTTCQELFQNVEINGSRMYNYIAHKKKLQIKMKRTDLKSTITRLKIANSMKILKGLSFLHVLNSLINMEKKLFILEIEQGGEVLIPSKLSQTNLPLNFTYYDPILQII